MENDNYEKERPGKGIIRKKTGLESEQLKKGNYGK